MTKKTSVSKRPFPPDPKARKMSKHLSFIESDDEDEEINVDLHREHFQVEASQSLQTSPVHQAPIRASMSADALTQMVTVESHSSKTVAKHQSATKVTKTEAKTMDRRHLNKPTKPVIKVTNTDARSTDIRPSNKAATLPAKVRKTSSGGGLKDGEPYVPKFLQNWSIQWEKIRRFLDATSENMDKPLHNTLPPQDAPWMKETSAVEQLRVFLATQS